MTTKYCPHCQHDLDRSSFTSTRAKYCNPCKRIIQLEQKQAMTERSLARTKIKKQKTVGILKISDLKKAVQREVNAYVRLRDRDDTCLACGKYQDKMDASHFIAQGSSGYLRYHPTNIHNTCYSCNRFKHGNLICYRINLCKKVGEHDVKWLEDNKDKTHKYTREQLIEIRNHCKQKTFDVKCWYEIMQTM